MDCTWSTFNHTLAVTHLLSTLRCKNEYIEWCIIFPSLIIFWKKQRQYLEECLFAKDERGTTSKPLNTLWVERATSTLDHYAQKASEHPGVLPWWYIKCAIAEIEEKNWKKKLPKCEGRLWAREVNKKKPAGNPHLHVIQDARRRLLHPQH